MLRRLPPLFLTHNMTNMISANWRRKRLTIMCKILAFNNLSRLNKKDFLKLVRVANEGVSKTERDGFGYAVQGERGVFGERALSPDDFVSVFAGPDKRGSFQASPDNIQNHFGVLSRTTGPAIFHGRTSTNKKSIENTHPFIKNDVHLIHNGVIDFPLEYDKKTTCDSEDLLEAYLMDKEALKTIEDHVTGYYAVALIENNHLRIFKDSRAWLYCAYVRTIDSFIFGTTKDLILNTCKAMRWSHGKVTRVKDDVYFGLDVQGNELFNKTIKPKIEVYHYAEQQASLSLAYASEAKQYDDASGNVKKWKEQLKKRIEKNDTFKRRSTRGHYSYNDYDYDVGFDDDYYGTYERGQYLNAMTGEEISASAYGKLPIDEKKDYRKIAY